MTLRNITPSDFKSQNTTYQHQLKLVTVVVSAGLHQAIFYLHTFKDKVFSAVYARISILSALFVTTYIEILLKKVFLLCTKHCRVFQHSAVVVCGLCGYNFGSINPITCKDILKLETTTRRCPGCMASTILSSQQIDRQLEVAERAKKGIRTLL